MIPGNRPEDVAEDAFWSRLNQEFEKDYPSFMEIIDWLHNEPPMLVEIEAALDAYAMKAREIGYSVGYDEGKAEAQIEEGMRQGRTRLPLMEAE
jgi:hypothetical protein